MGSATRVALTASKAALADLGAVKLSIAEELFSAGRSIGDSAQLRTLLTDPGMGAEDKATVVKTVFAKTLDAQTVSLLTLVAGERWSDSRDLLAGIEELGLRAAATSATTGQSLASELFTIETAIRSDSTLELALGSKLGDNAQKAALVERLLVNASPQTSAIVSQVVQQPRGRRIGESLRQAAAIVADQKGLAIATVTSAQALEPNQVSRLETALGAKYGRKITVNQVLDARVIGGLKISVGDDVIDGSVSTRLADLRAQLVR